MKPLFIEYPKCSTCQKAKKVLQQLEIDFEDRHIVENTPTSQELKEWIDRSGLPIQKFFNTSGNVYKELRLKEKLPAMNDDEKISLLSQNGMLIKRPLYIDDSHIIIGFNENVYQAIIKEDL